MVKDTLKFLFFPTLALLFGAILLRAGTLPFKNYTTADGLAHDQVGEIVRDSRGFLWFCTGEGLSRFDGYEFKNYTQAQGLPHRSVNDLLELEEEMYLVATSDGIAVFNPKGEANPMGGAPPMFRTFRVPFETSDQRPLDVSSFYKTRRGEIWAATVVGLYRVLREGDEWRLERAEAEAWRGKTPEVLAIAEDRFGRLWVSTSGSGLSVFNPDSGEVFPVWKTGGLSILEDRAGRIWADGDDGFGKSGLNLFELPDADSPPRLLRSFTTADGLSDNVWIHSLFQTSDGRILAAIRNGLNEFLPEARAGEPAFRRLFSSDIVSVGEDAGGNLWVGTATRGAFKLTRGGFELYQATEKQPYGGVTSIFPGGDGSEIFVTSSEFDLLRFDGEKFSEIQLPDVKHRSWGKNQLDLRSRFDGDWWIPSAYGLVRYAAAAKFEDLARAKPKRIYTTADGLFAEPVFNLFEDSRGDIWFSTLGAKDNLLRWDRRSDKIHRYTTADGLTEANAATAFAEDARGDIWFGFYSGGAARFRDGKFQTFSARSGFPTGYVSAIYTDRSGRIWIATSNSGAIRFDKPTENEPRYAVLNVGNGLSSNQTNCITEDNSGRIYIGTARGINRIEPETGRIRLYTQADGLPGNSIGRCARDAEGNLWFSQKFTLARLKVARDETVQPPPIFIGGLRVNGEETVKLSELGETTVQNLEFNSDQRQLQIAFFALGFGTGERLLYQYKLDETGADWSEPSAQRTVNLNLSSGNYRFLVRAINSEGVASENPAMVSFAIARPFWQRWSFRLFAALAITLIVFVIYRYRITQIIKLERVRTRIATDLHDDIGSSLSKIAILSEVVRQKNGAGANGTSEPLEIIANTSRSMVDSMSDIVWAINPERDHLSDLVQRMRHFSEEILDAQDVEYQFSGAQNLKNITLGADVRREVYMIFKECVNNLAKHSKCTKAEFEIRLENENLVIEIRDNGQGFAESTLSDETSSAFTAETNGGGSRSFGGNGLKNMRRRAENLGGELRIDSEIGKGTRIILKIPVGKKLFSV